MRILISACLLGVRCRYDGEGKPCPAAMALAKDHELVPVCPEQLGGMPTPRTPCERRGDKVISRAEEDRSAQYTLGAEQAAAVFDLLHCDCALLKARSPMCGCGQIYDGTFTGALISGEGVLAQLLRCRGIPVYTEENLPF